MKRTMMKGKIHRATVTDANLAYEGSITLDPVLMELADILPNEQVHVYDVDNGNRLITYAIQGERGAGGVCLNGAAARLVQPGDLVIVVSYAEMEDAQARGWIPKVVRVDERNRPLPAMHAEVAS
jgi:aspartate 1-decarboxylase